MKEEVRLIAAALVDGSPYFLEERVFLGII